MYTAVIDKSSYCHGSHLTTPVPHDNSRYNIAHGFLVASTAGINARAGAKRLAQNVDNSSSVLCRSVPCSNINTINFSRREYGWEPRGTRTPWRIYPLLLARFIPYLYQYSLTVFRRWSLLLRGSWLWNVWRRWYLSVIMLTSLCVLCSRYIWRL